MEHWMFVFGMHGKRRWGAGKGGWGKKHDVDDGRLGEQQRDERVAKHVSSCTVTRLVGRGSS
jgi:hypothetical protein